MMADYDEDDDPTVAGSGKVSNTLPLWGNEKSMNLNSLILTNIQGSSYFKVQLFTFKTYHEVVDEIYYRVQHLEPWEAGSRKIGGQTGMCGGVRGVGAGGIVSSAFCLLYKLFTLKLTRKQLTGMMNHSDSPYIRGLGFMYARYTLPPADLWDWFSDYLADEEEIDVKAGGGFVMYVGDMVRDFLMKLDWFGALFPRIPVPIQKTIVANMKEWGPSIKEQYQDEAAHTEKEKQEQEQQERETRMKQRNEPEPRRELPRDGYRDAYRERNSGNRHSGRDSGRDGRDSGRDNKDSGRDSGRDNKYSGRDSGRDKDRYSSSRSHTSSSRSHGRSGRDKDRHRGDDDFSKELKKAKNRVKDERRRSRSKDRKKRSGSGERRRSRGRSREKSRERSRDKNSKQRRSRS